MGINTPALRAYVLNPIGIIYTGASPPYRCRKIGSARKIPKSDSQNSFLKLVSKTVSVFENSKKL